MIAGEVNDAPWIGMSREDYEAENDLCDEERDGLLAAKDDEEYKAEQEEEILRRSRHADEVWRVYEHLIQYAIGKANAISAKNLCASLGWYDSRGREDTRRLREKMNEIRTSGDFEKVIGSGRNGYYACATPEEVDRTDNALRHHALSELQVFWANERKAGRNGQGKIICGEDGKPFIESLARAE